MSASLRAACVSLALLCACAPRHSAGIEPPAVRRRIAVAPSQWVYAEPELQGPCDPRNGQCPPRSLRVELRWDTPRTDLDLHAIYAPGQYTSAPWFTIADAHWGSPAPREVFGGNRRLVADVEDAGPPEVLEASPAGDGEYVIAVHFHTRYGDEARATATVRILCDDLEVARVTRILEASDQGERGNDFWQVGRVRMSAGAGCAVTSQDDVTPTADVDLWHQEQQRRREHPDP